MAAGSLGRCVAEGRFDIQHDDIDMEDQDEVRDVDRDEVWAALAVARAALVDHRDEVEHFSWSLRGGCWTKEHTGMDYDSFRANAASSEGRQFLLAYHLPQSATFALSRYGEHACAVFCRFWVSRMSFLMYCAGSKAAAEAFSEASLSEFKEPADFVELVGASAGHIITRANALRSIRPK
jgi:hypothetical protein